MDVHRRFMAHGTTEISHLFSTQTTEVKDFWKNVMTRSVKIFILDLNKLHTSARRIQFLTTFRTILCSFYKQKISCTQQVTPEESIHQRYVEIFKEIDIIEVQRVLNDSIKSCHAETSSVMLDILILHMVLFADVALILKGFKELQKLIHSDLVGTNKIRLLNIEIMECYMDSLNLHQMHSGLKKLEFEEISESFLNNIKAYLTLGNYDDFRLLTLLLPKMNEVFNKNQVLSKIWEMIFTSENDFDNILWILHMTVNIWFPIESNYDKSRIDQTMEERFWLIILEGLSSPEIYQREAALNLMKRAVDFVIKHKSRRLELGKYRKIEPLICIGTDSQQKAFKKNLDNFILVMAALEEEQEDLITPVLPLLQNLLTETFEPENKKTGLHFVWTRCALLQILRHDDNAIIRWGLVNVLTLDLKFYNDEFLSAVLDALNISFLYENDSNQEKPAIVNKLIIFLNNAESKNTDLVTRFLVKASKKAWGSVALYYMIHALSMVKRVTSIWKDDEVKAVKSLAKINSDMHCQVLRFGSHVELLDTMTHFATESLDLAVLTNTLLEFHTSGVLARGQPVWKRISAWISTIVRKKDALSFFEKICEQMASENLDGDLSVKSMSLIIVLFYDGHLILNSKFCAGFTALRNLLQCLIEAAARPYANAQLIKRSIKLIDHLLDLTSLTDCILHEFICDYEEATLRFIFKSLRNQTNDIHLGDIHTYGNVLQHFSTTEKSSISNTAIFNHIDRFKIEASNIIEDAEYTNNIRRVFGVIILYVCLTPVSDYRFIDNLYNTYKTLMVEPIVTAEEGKETSDENTVIHNKIAVEYYHYVALLFYDYVRDKPVDEWIPHINWIEQVLYLIKVGGKEILEPVVEILSQIYHKEAVKATDMDDFKTALRLCWKPTLMNDDFDELQGAMKKIINLIFSPPFLESYETRELTIEFTNTMVDGAGKNPKLTIILLEGLKQAKKEYIAYFYDAVLSCLLHGTVRQKHEIIELQARSYVLECHQEVYSTYFSNKDVNTVATGEAHAFTFLHNMISDDPTHAAKLLPLRIARLMGIQNNPDVDNSKTHRLRTRILQVLLVLQPMLKKVDIASLHSMICNNILSGSSEPNVRIMQEWLLVRMYVDSETLRDKIWDLFDQGEEKYVDSLCSVISVVYHVAQSLPPVALADFMILAFKHVVPCCMAQQLNVRLYAQVVMSKLYSMAAEKTYSTLIEKYEDLFNGVTKSLMHGTSMENSVNLQDDYYLTIFHPINHYSIQTLFHDLPRSMKNDSWDQFISPQLFEKVGFKESNRHPLTLWNYEMEK